jgi:hypothetical protein
MPAATAMTSTERIRPGESRLPPWCYDKPAAEQHWERVIALYRRRLR